MAIVSRSYPHPSTPYLPDAVITADSVFQSTIKGEFMARKKETCKKITIVIRGKSDSDLELAFEEACRAIRDGYLAGHNSNDTGAYYFETQSEVPKAEWPF